MSTIDTILAAVVTELGSVGNSTGIVAASYKDIGQAERAGMSGGVGAYVFAEETEKDHEANQYIFINRSLYISLFGRNLATLQTSAEVVATLFYKATPLANIRTAGADYILYERESPAIGTLNGVMRVDVALSLHYEINYT